MRVTAREGAAEKRRAFVRTWGAVSEHFKRIVDGRRPGCVIWVEQCGMSQRTEATVNVDGKGKEGNVLGKKVMVAKLHSR